SAAAPPTQTVVSESLRRAGLRAASTGWSSIPRTTSRSTATPSSIRRYQSYSRLPTRGVTFTYPCFSALSATAHIKEREPLTIRLGPNQYGKAETHLVRVTKGGPFGSVHEIKDISVSVALSGDFAGSHLTGDNSNIVTTDTQKNTVYAFAKEEPIGEIEQF